MTLFPEAQKRAQAEIDFVIGNARLPLHDDRPNLPYVDALVKEVFRWNLVTPLGTSVSLHMFVWKGLKRILAVPHRLIEDDIYEGYLFPKGTIVIANVWYAGITRQ